MIGCYQQVRDRPESVARYLTHYRRAHCSEFYYDLRQVYNSSKISAAQAARFIYLNQTCFNGVFRVNLLGKYNVPFGLKEFPNLPTRAQLRLLANELTGATLITGDFETTLRHARRGDFVYLDPPYPPLNGTAFFAHYTMDRFGEFDQERLASAVRDLDRRGCLVMLSNADLPLVRRLYHGLAVRRLSVTRFVSSKKQKHRVHEVVIMNY